MNRRGLLRYLPLLPLVGAGAAPKVMSDPALAQRADDLRRIQAAVANLKPIEIPVRFVIEGTGKR